MDLKEYTALQEEVERIKTLAGRKEGIREEKLHQLKKDFDCETEEEAEKLLNKLTARQRRFEDEYKEDQAKFNGKWASKLEEAN